MSTTGAADTSGFLADLLPWLLLLLLLLLCLVGLCSGRCVVSGLLLAEVCVVSGRLLELCGVVSCRMLELCGGLLDDVDLCLLLLEE